MHIYSACAVGVGAVLTSPANAESWAASSLPIIGGRSVSQAGPVDWPAGDPVLHFDRARTEITGSQNGAQFTTTIRKTVTGLCILHRLEGDIDVTFTFVYTANAVANRHLDAVAVAVNPAQPFAGISIPGVTLPAITLEAGVFQQAGQNFKQFRQALQNPAHPRAGNKHHKHAQGEAPGHNQGVIFTALANPVGSFVYQSPDHGRLDVPGLGRVYFAEWWGEPYRQSVTLLRVMVENSQDRLNPAGTFSGQIVIDGEENGREFP